MSTEYATASESTPWEQVGVDDQQEEGQGEEVAEVLGWKTKRAQARRRDEDSGVRRSWFMEGGGEGAVSDGEGLPFAQQTLDGGVVNKVEENGTRWDEDGRGNGERRRDSDEWRMWRSVVQRGSRVKAWGGPEKRRDDLLPLKDLECGVVVDGPGDASEAGWEADREVRPSSTRTPRRGYLRTQAAQDSRSPFSKTSGLAATFALQEGLFGGGGGMGNEYPPQSSYIRGGVLSSLLMLYETAYERGEEEWERPARGLKSVGETRRAKTPSRRHRRLFARWTDPYELLPTFNRVKVPASPGYTGRLNEAQRYEEMQGMRRGPRDIHNLPQYDGPAEQTETSRIQAHLMSILQRQSYIAKLCHALIAYGAPTHRLEDYMHKTAQRLSIDGQFLSLPGCMIIAFDDALSHTTEVRLVRTAPDIDLGRLRDVHQVYKEVLHGVVGVQEASRRLDRVAEQVPEWGTWWRVLAYGVAVASVGPFAFGASWIDLPPSFLLGICFGVLRLFVAPLTPLLTNVFELTATTLFLFLSRFLGSFHLHHRPSTSSHSSSSAATASTQHRVFCFPALAQSSICFVLPGYMIVCAALELQSRAIVPGAIRIVHALIYSMFLGFGMTLGIALYGLIDHSATTATTCPNPLSPIYLRFLFIPPFTLALAVLNQARLEQMPVMVFLALLGFVSNFFAARAFPAVPEISNAMGAFAIGVLGNLYSRTRHGAQAVCLLPAILVQVPSGLMAAGGLLVGLEKVEGILGEIPLGTLSNVDSIMFNVGYRMMEIAVGIAVGLTLSSLVVYPLDKKKKSGLFGF